MTHLFEGKEIVPELVRGCFHRILEGEADPVQVSAFLMGLELRGYPAEVVYEASCCLLEKAVSVPFENRPQNIVDLAGTGGDRSGSLNLSTAAAFVVAAAGLPVVKHGNRAVSSRCGSADLLEAMGAWIDHSPAQAAKIFEATRFVFLYAPIYQPAMRNVAAVRKALGIRTIFNIMGPLVNPVRPDYQIIGTPSIAIARRMAGALSRHVLRRALVFTGPQGLDELVDFDSPPICLEVRPGFVRDVEIPKFVFGKVQGSLADISGGNPADNARVIREIFSGKKHKARTSILVNAGAALFVAGMDNTFADACERARQAVDFGQALELLDKYIRETQRIGPKVA